MKFLFFSCASVTIMLLSSGVTALAADTLVLQNNTPDKVQLYGEVKSHNSDIRRLPANILPNTTIRVNYADEINKNIYEISFIYLDVKNNNSCSVRLLKFKYLDTYKYTYDILENGTKLECDIDDKNYEDATHKHIINIIMSKKIGS